MAKNTNITHPSLEQIDSILVNILSDTAADAERKQFDEWLELDESHRDEFARIQSYWNASVQPVAMPDDDACFSRVISKIDKSQKSSGSLKRMLSAAVFAAASLLVGTVCGLAISDKIDKPTDSFTYLSGEALSSLSLPDGSHVYLNRNSQLSYNSDFGEEERVVHLTGEAYFDVSKMDKKFVVDMGDASITVKGTSFNAYNYPDAGIKGAALVEGSVEFSTASQKLQLKPLRKVDYDSATQDLTVNSFDPLITTAWKDNLFRYNAVSFEELIMNIEKHYRVSIEYAEGAFSGSYTGSLDLGMSIAQLLDIVSIQTGARWTQKEGIYYILK